MECRSLCYLGWETGGLAFPSYSSVLSVCRGLDSTGSRFLFILLRKPQEKAWHRAGGFVGSFKIGEELS